MSNKLLTIIVNCVNKDNMTHLSKTLESISHDQIETICINHKDIENTSAVKTIYNGHLADDFLEAIRLSEGQYITFLNDGDVFYKESLNRLLKEMKTLENDVIHCSVVHTNSFYQIKNLYKTGKSKVYLNDSYSDFPTIIKGTFIKKELISNIDIKVIDKGSESYILAHIFNQSKNQNLYMSNCVISFLNWRNTFEDAFSKEFPVFLENALNKEKCSPVVQYYTLAELRKMLVPAHIKYVSENYTLKEKEIYLNKIKTLLGNIESKSILQLDTIIIPYKNYMMKLKYEEDYEQNLGLCSNENKTYVTYRNQPLYDITYKGNFKINVLENKNNVLVLDGLDSLNFLGERFDIVAIDNNNHVYEAQTFDWPLADKEGFIGEKVFRGRRFKFEIPLNKVKSLDFKIRVDKEELFGLIPSFGKYAKLVKKVRTSYFAKGNYIITYKKKGLSIKKNTFKAHFKHEVKMLLKCVKDKKIEIAILRTLYHIMSFFKKKPIWLIRDNEKRAKDSGAEMFKFYSQYEHKDQMDAYFILDSKCSDYEKMKGYGAIIQPDSFKYKLYHLLADKLIDTRGGIDGKYIFKEDYIYVNDLITWDYIWLIHGIMTRNESTWTNKYVLNAKLFATCNKREYASVLDEQNCYGYDEGEVALTGLPRHDSLFANKQKKVLFLPTWRKHLAGDLIPGTSDRSYVLNFKENEYYQFYNTLINDPRLLEVMRRKGYTGDFYLHPSFMKQCNDFVENDVIRVGKEPADTNQLIGECSLLITDYSSAQFEGAYLDTPVIYPQYDADTFSENHTGNDGYFDYEDDGFGPVCYDLESTVNAIIDYIERDCQNVEPYHTRAAEFFVYHDHNNSRRVFECLLKNNKDKDNIMIEKDEDNLYLYQGEQLKNKVSIEDKSKLYNPLIHIISYVKSIDMKEESFRINGELIINDKDFKLPSLDLCLSIGEYSQPIELTHKKKSQNEDCYSFKCEIEYKNILLNKKSTPVFLSWTDKNGYGYKNNLKYQFARNSDTLANQLHRKLHFSDVAILKDLNTSIFVRETIGNNVYMCIRDINVTDTKEEQNKLKFAYFLSRVLWFHKAKKSMIFYEKFASKYEESASVLFEKVIDEGHKNAYYVIDKNSIHCANIPDKYKKNIIYKYSFKHYLYFFMSTMFVSTESMNHMIELNIADPNVSLKVNNGHYDYIFLQHGVMYMYCLENRSDFIKGQGFTRSSKVVVSSQTEANHFIDYGYFNQNDLIISGLPKFDRNTRNKDADKILIMPTSRDFEYNVIRLTPKDSTYYKFVKNIIEHIPAQLKDKIIVVGHPLLKDQLESTDLKQYMPEHYIYNDLLKQTKLLITDYSSISYDAFYRGSNVVFCWEDKDMCLGAMGYKLMLNDENVFADVSYSFDDLEALVIKNYYSDQEEEHIAKYRDIVTHHDNNNTNRCYEFLKKNKYLGNRKKIKLSKVKIKNFTKKVYTGDKRIHTNLELNYKNRTLVRNKDYRIFYFNNRRISKYAIAIFVGCGAYFGVRVKPFKICPSIAGYQVRGIKVDHNMIDTSLVSVYGDRNGYLVKDKDFSVSVEEISANVKKVIIKGIKNYGGKQEFLYKVND